MGHVLRYTSTTPVLLQFHNAPYETDSCLLTLKCGAIVEVSENYTLVRNKGSDEVRTRDLLRVTQT